MQLYSIVTCKYITVYGQKSYIIIHHAGKKKVKSKNKRTTKEEKFQESFQKEWRLKKKASLFSNNNSYPNELLKMRSKISHQDIIL